MISTTSPTCWPAPFAWPSAITFEVHLRDTALDTLLLVLNLPFVPRIGFSLKTRVLQFPAVRQAHSADGEFLSGRLAAIILIACSRYLTKPVDLTLQESVLLWRALPSRPVRHERPVGPDVSTGD